VPCLYLVSFFVALDLAMTLAGSAGVAHTAHIWGAILGFGVTAALLAMRLLPRDPFDFLALVHRWNRRRQYQSLVASGYDPFGTKPPLAASHRSKEEREVWDPTVEKIKELRAQVHEAIAHHNLPHAAILFLELKALDPDQVLSRQAQLDVANQLASQQFHREAADAYEQFLRHYPNYAQIEHVELMLGLIYARYLNRPPRARELLERAVRKLHGEHEIRMARGELEKLHVG
jgi:tetratricopeptide (TPR) repeat protein